MLIKIASCDLCFPVTDIQHSGVNYNRFKVFFISVSDTWIINGTSKRNLTDNGKECYSLVYNIKVQ
jgi:hypothetical protein